MNLHLLNKFHEDYALKEFVYIKSSTLKVFIKTSFDQDSDEGKLITCELKTLVSHFNQVLKTYFSF